MPLENIIQPDFIQVSDNLRLRKYDGNYETALEGYRDPYVYQNSEGIFDEAKKPDLSYVEAMFNYLDRVGEAYFIEVLKDGEYVSVGDVTVKPENPPIAIWYAEYRGAGIGTAVMKTVIQRLKELGYDRVTGSVVYKWNAPSLHMHQKLGFRIVSEDEKEYILELKLK